MILGPLTLLVAAAVSAAGWPALSSGSGPGGGENDAAVIVGVEDYAFVADIPGARKNAEDWHAFLTGGLKIPADRVALLRDNDATLEDLRRHAAEAAAAVKPGGTLWFVFVGHGAPSKDGADGLLVGSDAQQKADSLYARSLPRAELLELLSKGAQKKTVVLLDACFSGRVSAGRPLVAGLQPLIAARAGAAADPRAIVLTAARSDQFAGPLPMSQAQRPAFSYLALGALRGWAADAAGKITAGAVRDYVGKALRLAKDRVQIPELAFGAPDALLGEGRERGPDLAAIEREGGEGAFRVTAPGLVPSAQAPAPLDAAASSLNFRSVDLGSLKRYDEVYRLEKDPKVSAERKTQAWRALGADVPQFADLSKRRAAEWDAFALSNRIADEGRRARRLARDDDWRQLGELLELAVVPAADKAKWSAEFVTAYEKSPGLTSEMARALAANAGAPALRARLKKLADTAPSFEAEKRAEAFSSAARPSVLYGQPCGWRFGMTQVYPQKGEALAAVRARAFAELRKEVKDRHVIGESVEAEGFIDKNCGNCYKLNAYSCYVDPPKAEGGYTRWYDPIVVDLKAGDGDAPDEDDEVLVQYEGTAQDGAVVDSTYRRGKPETIKLAGALPCWKESLPKLKKGARARVLCPADKAYGEKGNGPIPPWASLNYVVEVLDVVKK